MQEGARSFFASERERVCHFEERANALNFLHSFKKRFNLPRNLANKFLLLKLVILCAFVYLDLFRHISLDYFYQYGFLATFKLLAL